ncbi:MAG: hypothetical protein IKY21_03210 [Clostridia bacterium]|nr:hypothetical protein [Clostridia bacterium]
MKNNKKIAAIAFCMVIAATLLFSVTAFAMSDVSDTEKEFVPDEFESAIPSVELETAPESQSDMQAKFNEFISVENDGKTAILFSDEQYEALLAVRNEGKRNALSYEEALYLINDTIGMYSQYEEIVIKSEMIDLLGLEFYLGGNSGIIVPDENDYSKTVRDIYSLILYRLYLHDSGFVSMYTGHLCIPEKAESEFLILFEGDKRLESKESDGTPWITNDSVYFVNKRIFLLAFDNGSEIGADYNNTLMNNYIKWADEDMAAELAHRGIEQNFDFEGNSLSAPMLVIDMPLEGDNMFVNSYTIDIVTQAADSRDRLYPTPELAAAKPEGYFDRIHSFPIESITVSIGFPHLGAERHEVTKEEFDSIKAILDNGKEWSYGIHVGDITARFTVDQCGINYYNGALYNTETGRYLTLTSEENEFIVSLIEKYK